MTRASRWSVTSARARPSTPLTNAYAGRPSPDVVLTCSGHEESKQAVIMAADPDRPPRLNARDVVPQLLLSPLRAHQFGNKTINIFANDALNPATFRF